MANSFTDTQDFNSATTEYQNNKIGLPLFALAIVLAPIPSAFLGSWIWGSEIQVPFLIFILIFVISPYLPIPGAILGVIIVAQDSKKAPIGKTRRILATTAVAISLFYLVLYIILMIFS